MAIFDKRKKRIPKLERNKKLKGSGIKKRFLSFYPILALSLTLSCASTPKQREINMEGKAKTHDTTYVSRIEVWRDSLKEGTTPESVDSAANSLLQFYQTTLEFAPTREGGLVPLTVIAELVKKRYFEEKKNGNIELQGALLPWLAYTFKGSNFVVREVLEALSNEQLIPSAVKAMKFIETPDLVAVLIRTVVRSGDERGMAMLLKELPYFTYGAEALRIVIKEENNQDMLLKYADLVLRVYAVKKGVSNTTEERILFDAFLSIVNKIYDKKDVSKLIYNALDVGLPLTDLRSFLFTLYKRDMFDAFSDAVLRIASYYDYYSPYFEGVNSREIWQMISSGMFDRTPEYKYLFLTVYLMVKPREEHKGKVEQILGQSLRYVAKTGEGWPPVVNDYGKNPGKAKRIIKAINALSLMVGLNRDIYEGGYSGLIDKYIRIFRANVYNTILALLNANMENAPVFSSYLIMGSYIGAPIYDIAADLIKKSTNSSLRREAARAIYLLSLYGQSNVSVGALRELVLDVLNRSDDIYVVSYLIKALSNAMIYEAYKEYNEEPPNLYGDRDIKFVPGIPDPQLLELFFEVYNSYNGLEEIKEFEKAILQYIEAMFMSGSFARIIEKDGVIKILGINKGLLDSSLNFVEAMFGKGNKVSNAVFAMLAADLGANNSILNDAKRAQLWRYVGEELERSLINMDIVGLRMWFANASYIKEYNPNIPPRIKKILDEIVNNQLLPPDIRGNAASLLLSSG